jgi:hypothetical protein
MVDGGASGAGSGDGFASRRRDRATQALAIVLLMLGIALALLILVVPVYSSESVTVTDGDPAIFSTGSATLLAHNPDAAPLLIGLVCAVLLMGVAAVLVAWTNSKPAWWLLVALLPPLLVVTVLSLPSIGLFIVPVLVLGFVTALHSEPRVRGALAKRR